MTRDCARTRYCDDSSGCCNLAANELTMTCCDPVSKQPMPKAVKVITKMSATVEDGVGGVRLREKLVSYSFS
jgi:hypothetical protein